MGNFQERGAVGPGIGLFPKTIVAKAMMNRTGGQVIAGNIGQVDLLDLATETTTYTAGGEGSAWRNVGIPTTAGLLNSPFVVWNETVADDFPGECTLVGMITVAVAAVGAVGNRLVAVNAAQNLAIGAAGLGASVAKVIGIRLTAGTGAPGTSLVLFNGDEGFGWDQS